MIKNFEVVKEQLAQLSDILNKFKSEQVQLKIVELVFKGAGIDPDGGPDATNGEPHGGKKRGRGKGKQKAIAKADTATARKRASSGTGAFSTVEQFIQDGFFSQKRTIGALVDHCKAKARNFKSNELSGPLGRLVRNNRLSRAKNSDGQWEYIKK